MPLNDSKTLSWLHQKNAMNESAEYQPVNGYHEPKSSSETEGDMLISKDPPARRRRRSLTWPVIAIAAVLALAIYTSIVASVTWGIAKDGRRRGARFLKSCVFSLAPANNYITYESHVMEQWEYPSDIAYFGEPSEQIDRNWHDLFEPDLSWFGHADQNIGFSAELMHELGREEEGIRLPDGTYFGSIMVFHHLHCLKNIYHALHPAYYHLDILEGHEKAMLWEHTDHCLHMLMEAIRCQGDTTVLTMLWDAGGARPIGNLTSPHECVNWDRLMEWVVPNSVDVFADGVLVHPKLGMNIPLYFLFPCLCNYLSPQIAEHRIDSAPATGPLFKDGKPSKEFVDSLGATGKVNGVDQ
ncbi:Uncharacterized protein TCAP_00291 [Tolypocladium capitatum]|uniref:Tat pathway signal sequence n=1 Tax=Tolypocladium capitatum TaxID=45235 RepID=A0A2K3QQK5_9HYPO|nr:Uncharacterized protein TCAP_00291 [Tolypocladium capitatum]